MHAVVTPTAWLLATHLRKSFGKSLSSPSIAFAQDSTGRSVLVWEQDALFMEIKDKGVL